MLPTTCLHQAHRQSPSPCQLCIACWAFQENLAMWSPMWLLIQLRLSASYLLRLAFTSEIEQWSLHSPFPLRFLPTSCCSMCIERTCIVCSQSESLLWVCASLLHTIVLARLTEITVQIWWGLTEKLSIKDVTNTTTWENRELYTQHNGLSMQAACKRDFIIFLLQ